MRAFMYLWKFLSEFFLDNWIKLKLFDKMFMGIVNEIFQKFCVIMSQGSFKAFLYILCRGGYTFNIEQFFAFFKFKKFFKKKIN